MQSEFDVVCIGSGAGGLGAALAVADAGASVLVLEKGEKLGGTTAYSNGEIWVGSNRLADQSGMPDSPDEVREYLDFLSDGIATSSLRDSFITRGSETVNFLLRCGVKLQVIRGLADYYYPAAAGAKSEGRYLEAQPFTRSDLGEMADQVLISPHETSWVTNDESVALAGQAIEIMKLYNQHQERGELCGGAGLIAALIKASRERGAQFRTSACATRLIWKNGRIRGVKVSNNGASYTIGVKRGVVLATGGYDHNKTLLKAFELHDDVYGLAPTTVTGDHILLGGQVGAAVIKTKPPHISPLILGFHTPGEVQDGIPKYRYCMSSMAHSIIVNRKGQRYSRTDLYPHVMGALEEVDDAGELRNWPTWQILDQNFRDRFPLGDVAPGAPLPDGMAATANSIAELAQTAGIDPEGLESAVQRWNAFCDKGVDEDFGRGTSPFEKGFFGGELGKIERAPFVAVKLSRVSANAPSAGLQINGDGQAIGLDGNPIPGLFAAGMAAATVDTGARYQSGLGISRGLTYGYAAAKKMMSEQFEYLATK